MKKPRWSVLCCIIALAAFFAAFSCSQPSGPGDASGPASSILTVSLIQDDHLTPGVAPVSQSVDGGGRYSYQADAVWTQCPDDDFAWYAIYRSSEPGIAGNPENSDTSVVFSDVSSTSWTDHGLVEGETYYYALRTVDAEDLDAWSNEETVTVPPATPPEPSQLNGTYTGSTLFGQVSLSWTQCPDGDFGKYRLYRSLNPGIEANPSSASLVCETTEVTSTSYQDNYIEGLTTYYYALETVDDTELSSWSNEISVSTPDLTPRLTVFFVDPSYNNYYSGDAIIIKTPGNRYYLIDGGDRTSGWSCGVDRVMPILDSLGVDSLDGIVGTHPHADHIGGLIGVLQNMPVFTVWDSGYEHTTYTYEQYMDAILSNGSDYITPRRGDILNWDDDLQVECLHPTSDLGPDPNNASIVLRITFHEVSFLFTGDLESDDELEILAEVSDVSADILKVGHHGSHTSTSIEFLAAVDPSYAAIEVGYGNPYGHPHAEVIDRLEDWGAVIYRTDLDGTFIMTTDGTDIQVIP